MERKRIGKRIGSLFLTLAMVLTMSVTALPSYAADGNINIVYNPQVEGLTSTPYTLYKVGGFKYDEVSGKSSIALAPSLTGEGIPDVNNIKVPEDTTDVNSEDYVKWEADWLAAADSLAKFISTNEDAASATKAKDGTLTVQKTAQPIGSFDRGIYLLVGEKQRVGNKYWWPVPVLIMVLNGDTTFSIAAQNDQGQDMRYNEVKMQSKPVIYKHTVNKLWDEASPESTRGDIRVGIFYGEGENLQDVDSVTLAYNKEKVQTYTWYSTEVEDGDKITVNYYTVDPDSEGAKPVKSFTVDKSSTWSVREMRETAAEREALKYYESEVTYSADGSEAAADSSWSSETNSEEVANITNTFKQAKLVINKDLQSYLDQNSANAMVVFEITGKVKGATEPGSSETEEKVVYHNKVAMAFTGPGTKALTVDNIPVNLDSLEVKEIYATNYRVDPEGSDTVNVDLTEVTPSEDGVKTYIVNFTNVYNNKTEYSKGIVNNYENQGDGFKIVTRDDGKQ